MKAPASGEVLVPMIETASGMQPWVKSAKAKRYFVLNIPGHEYTLFVGDEPVSFKFPADFDFDKQVQIPAARAGEPTPFDLVPRGGLRQEQVAGSFVQEFQHPSSSRVLRKEVFLVRTGRFVEEGDSLLNFDLVTGDQLFVDRMSYHFVRPAIGDGFVFKTGKIPALMDDKFYIKRLVGRPGDEVQIEGSALYVNGEPAEGSPAFELNANKVGNYAGYTARSGGESSIDLSRPVTVPENAYLALGDNSYNSLDGRYWGFVPEESVVGRPILIYYPFSRRFGFAE